MTTRTNTAIHHLIVYKEPDRFGGWPANHGIWHWGDEILVGFERVHYEVHEQEHSIRRDLPSEMRFARSLDGGETWRMDGETLWTLQKPSLITSTREKPIPLHEPIDFIHPDFVMKSLGSQFGVSYDRGKHWHGPFTFLDPGLILA